MSLVKISRETDLTYGNMPDDVFQYITSQMRHGDDGGPLFEIDAPNSLVVSELLKSAVVDISNGIKRPVISITGNIMSVSAENIVTTNDNHPDPEYAIDRGEVNCDDEEDDEEGDVEGGDDEGGDDEGEDDEGEDDENCRCISAPPVPIILKIDGNERQMLAIAMENQTTIDAKHLSEKIKELDKLWTKVIGMRREITAMTTSIENNPLITEIINAVEELRASDNLIDDIFWADGFVVMKTKELITDNLIEGKRRIIGKMHIKINLKPLLADSTSVSSPVEIKNMDRIYKCGDEIWHCGHVFHREVCWGNMQDQLVKAFEERDLLALSEVIIRFIKNPNPADEWGEHLKYWPEVTN